MFKIFLSLTFLLAALGCQKEVELQNRWDMILTVQGKSIPFQLNFKNDKEVELVNGAETILLTYTSEEGSVTIPILNFDSKLELSLKDHILRGYWARPNKNPAYREPVTGELAEKPMTLPDYPFPFKWKMDLIDGDKSTEAILVFTAEGDGKYASVLTPTGDYRYLTPHVRGDKLILTRLRRNLRLLFHWSSRRTHI